MASTIKEDFRDQPQKFMYDFTMISKYLPRFELQDLETQWKEIISSFEASQRPKKLQNDEYSSSENLIEKKTIKLEDTLLRQSKRNKLKSQYYG
jgi:hypothetical protein